MIGFHSSLPRADTFVMAPSAAGMCFPTPDFGLGLVCGLLAALIGAKVWECAVCWACPLARLSGKELALLAREGSETHGADGDQPTAWSWAQKSPAWISEIPATHRHLSREWRPVALHHPDSVVIVYRHWEHSCLRRSLTDFITSCDLEFKRHFSISSSFSVEGEGQAPEERASGAGTHTWKRCSQRTAVVSWIQIPFRLAWRNMEAVIKGRKVACLMQD